MKLHYALPLVVSVLALAACSDPTDYNFQNSIDNAQAGFDQVQAENPDPNATSPEAVFDPANGALPFPNALLFGGSEDGTLNIPLDDGVPATDPRIALNTLDGFSTTEAITAAFGNAIDPATVVLGQTVFVYEVSTDSNGLVTGVVEELAADRVFATVVGGNTLAIVPLAPLKESTDYMVIATNDILGIDGIASSASSSFRLAAGDIPLTGELVSALEPIRLLINSMITAAVDRGVDRAKVVQAWTTKTQSITPVMTAVANASQSGGAISIVPFGGATTSDLNPAALGLADVYIGTLDVPYYRTRPENPNDVVGANSFWTGQGGSFLTRFNTTPTATSVQTIPVLMTVPNASSGQSIPTEGGWPVVIFVHGVTNDRTNMLAIADSMARAGFVVIAIDQAMHGITDPDSPLSAANTAFPNDVERTFNIDLVNESGDESAEPGPDGVVDSSGRHYYSPAQLLASRDNLRQSVADLLVLSASIDNIEGVELDETRKAVVGHSLGGTTATTFAAFDDTISSVSLGMPAAGLVRGLLVSESYGPPLLAGLAANGLEQGTAEFSQFLVAAQTVIDSGDSINFGALAASKHPIHMIEVVGDGTETFRADTVVPNNVVGAPLAGTEALARVMGLVDVTADTNGSGIVKFTAGNHASLLLPTASLDATVEMQTQLATFAATSGTLIKITNPAVIQTSE